MVTCAGRGKRDVTYTRGAWRCTRCTVTYMTEIPLWTGALALMLADRDLTPADGCGTPCCGGCCHKALAAVAARHEAAARMLGIPAHIMHLHAYLPTMLRAQMGLADWVGVGIGVVPRVLQGFTGLDGRLLDLVCGRLTEFQVRRVCEDLAGQVSARRAAMNPYRSAHQAGGFRIPTAAGHAQPEEDPYT